MAFLQTSGTHFTLDGNLHLPFGATIYASTGTTELMQARVDDAVAFNFNILRIVNYLTKTEAGVISEVAWARNDYLLNAAREAGIKILIDFSDFYSMQRDHLGRSQSEQDWDDFLDFVLNRVNTINGRVYKDDDAIGMFTIAGEIDHVGSDFDQDVYNFYSYASALIKSKGAQQLVCTGGIEYYVGFDEMTSISTIDCVASHPYNNNLGPNRSKLAKFIDYGESSRTHNKPWFLEEFGATHEPYGDRGRAIDMHQVMQGAQRNGAAGFLYWNLYPYQDNGNESFNIGTGDKFRLSRGIVKLHSHIKSYSPRIPVFAADASGYPDNG